MSIKKQTVSKHPRSIFTFYSLTGITIVFLICMVLEFLIMFTGVTLFNDRGNLVQMCFHVFGIIATSLFILDDGHYYELWKIWIVGG